MPKPECLLLVSAGGSLLMSILLLAGGVGQLFLLPARGTRTPAPTK